LLVLLSFLISRLIIRSGLRISHSKVFSSGYSIESRTDRTDTTGGRGGGIIVYVKDGPNILVSDHDDSDFNHYCSFSITTNDDVFNFICFY